MKILFWQWHSFMGKGMERALHRLNIAYDTFFYQMNDWNRMIGLQSSWKRGFRSRRMMQ